MPFTRNARATSAAASVPLKTSPLPITGMRIDGVETRSMPRHELRKKFGMVLQETWLQAGTVRQNIAMGRPQAAENEIIAAAKACHAHGFIMRLPKGYDTVLDEAGDLIGACRDACPACTCEKCVFDNPASNQKDEGLLQLL